MDYVCKSFHIMETWIIDYVSSDAANKVQSLWNSATTTEKINANW